MVAPSCNQFDGLENSGRLLVIDMSSRLLILLFTAHFAAAGTVATAKADTFGSAGNEFAIDFVTIPLPYIYDYGVFPPVREVLHPNFRMGRYEVTQNQIDAAVANGLQNVQAGAWSGDRPAADISWLEAAAFVNYLNTSTGHEAAYSLAWDGAFWSLGTWNGSTNGLLRNPSSYYFLPNDTEWQAALTYDPATSSYSLPNMTAVTSGTAPNTAVFSDYTINVFPNSPASAFEAGGLSPCGTMGQVGNVSEWIEDMGWPNDVTSNITEVYGTQPRGGSYEDLMRYNVSYLGYARYDIGLRVASVPEPSTYALFGFGALVLLAFNRRRKSRN
jgi:sulfatase modifying factor 1